MMKSLGGNPKLDQFVLDIEFLLISVVQGIAIAALAGAAIEPISSLNFQYWPYIISGFLITFIFWSQAIIHALSFIDWPLDLSHSFMYFLASFVQVASFSKINDPLHWFAFISGLFVVAGILYVIDYRIIKNREKDFNEQKSGKQLYHHILKGHIFELKFLVPAGLIFNIGAFFLIYKNPTFFIDNHWHIAIIMIQVLFESLILLNSMKTFKKRSKLIAGTF